MKIVSFLRLFQTKIHHKNRSRNLIKFYKKSINPKHKLRQVQSRYFPNLLNTLSFNPLDFPKMNIRNSFPMYLTFPVKKFCLFSFHITQQKKSNNWNPTFPLPFLWFICDPNLIYHLHSLKQQFYIAHCPFITKF